MADKITQERSKDGSIKTDDLDFGSIDSEIALDFPGAGDEGIEFGTGRKPTNAKKSFVIEALKGIGGGVKSAAKQQLSRALPDVAALAHEVKAGYDDMQMVKDDIARQLAPMATTIENSGRKLLPKAEKYLPKKVYEKLHKKLDERAKARVSYSGPSKEQRERDTIAADLASLFEAQSESTMAQMREHKKELLFDRALGSTRHRQTQIGMAHIYDAVRSTESFHRQQHMAYMKKSLELKYKHIFIARDTFNLLQQSMRTFEGYYKAMVKNTALPDMTKVKARDFIAKSRTEKYGTMMASAVGNIRSAIFRRLKQSINDNMGMLGGMVDMLGTGADMAEMADGMGGGKDRVPGLLGKLLGWGAGSIGLSKLRRKYQPFADAINVGFAGMRSNAMTHLSNLHNKMAQSNNFFANMLSDFLPNPFAVHKSASNDILTKGKEAAAFDVITRQSITEIIPGYLGKILHEVTKIRTGDDNVEEQVFNVFERKMTGVGALKQDMYDRAFGDEEARRKALTETLATMQAGAARNGQGSNAQTMYKGYEPDINRVMINHAMFGQAFNPRELYKFVGNGDYDKMYIEAITRGIDDDRKAKTISLIVSAMFDQDGNLDRKVMNDISLSIQENFRKQDMFKSQLPEYFETFGLRQYVSSDLTGAQEKELKRILRTGTEAEKAMARQKLQKAGGLVSSAVGENELNLEEMSRIRADIDYGKADVDKMSDFTRRRRYEKYADTEATFKKMLDAGDAKGLNKILGGVVAGGHGAFLKTFGRIFGDNFDWQISPELAKANIDQMTEEEKARFAQGLAKGLGIMARDKGPAYKDVFKVDNAFTDSGKPEEKKVMGIRESFDEILKKTSGKTTGDIGKSIQDTVYGAIGRAHAKVSKFVADPQVKAKCDAAVAELKKRKEQLKNSEAGKKALEQLEVLEEVINKAKEKGDEGIDWLKQAGAFDNPTQFLKDQLKNASKEVVALSEELPPLTDTAAWGELVSQKTSTFTTTLPVALGPAQQRTTGLFGAVKAGLAGTVDSLKKKFGEGFAAATGGTGGAAPEAPAGAPIGAPASSGGGVPPEGPTLGVNEFKERDDRLYDLLSGWHTENVENQGTIFDAIASIDETLKSIGGIRVGGGAMNEEELAKQIGKGMRKHSLLRKGLHAAKEGVAGTVKGVGKLYARTYSAALKGAGTALKGMGYAAGTAIDRGYKMASSIGKWLTEKPTFVDVYLKGREGGIPLVTARKQKEEGIFRKSNGKRIEASNEINEPCVDKDGNLVITAEDLKTGLVINNGSRIGKLGSGALSLAKTVAGGYFKVYGKALGAIGGVAKTIAQGLFGKAAERWQDVYRKDEIFKGPLVTARQQKEDGVYFFASGKQVERSSDIHEPICDKDKKMLVTKDDIEHGLVNVDNKPLGSGATNGLLRNIGNGIAKALPGLGKAVGSLSSIYAKGYKGLLELGIGGLKGVGKFLGRALGLNTTGGVGDGEKTLEILGKIQADVALMAARYKKMNPLDKDGDGDIDGSYADQMEKKKLENKRVDARDVHKDVNWKKEEKSGGGKDDDDGGGGLFDLIKHLIPDKWGRKLKVGKYLLKKRGLAALGKAGRFLLGKGSALRAAAMPALSTAGHWLAGTAMPAVGSALGTAGSAIGGALGSSGTAIGSALGGMGGLAGIGGTLASLAGPAALAALAGYGIYRGVKGFSKKNTLENLGASNGISNENQLTGEDRMYSALGLNSKFGAKTAKFISQGLGIHGLIKGIRGNDNPLTDKEIEKGRTKLQRKIDKGLPGYDRILQEYEKAVTAGNWKRARELSGQEADGLIKSMWKNSWVGMATKGIGNFLFGNKDKEMTAEEIKKTRDKFNSKIKKGGNVGKNAEKLLSKFDDAVAEQDWKKAREIAGAEQRGLFGKLFQDSNGNVQWGKVIGLAAGGLVGYGIGALFSKADVNKPMTEEEVKSNRERLLKLVNAGGNGAKAAQKVLDQFDEAVTEQNWKKARQLCGEEVKSNLAKLGSAVATTTKWTTRIATLGLSTLFESDQDKPMTEEEIKKFTDKMNYLINKHHDKVAQRKLDRFEECIAAQKWDKARQIAKMPHKSLVARAAKAYFSFWWGDDEKPMEEAEMQKFRDSMERKIKLGGATARVAQKKLDAFEDAVGAQRWKRARTIAQAPNDGLMQKGAKAYGKWAANNFRFIFGGDGKPMSPNEIEQARKELGWAVSEGKKGAQKRLDRFEDLVADEKWEKARALAKMPYDNIVSRVAKGVGGWLFGNDKNAMTPEEIDKFRGELEQKIADNPKAAGKLNKMLDQFNSAVEAENWPKARKISGNKDWGFLGSVAKGLKALNPFSWFSSDYDDCQELKTKIEEKIDEEGDDSGMISKGLQHFDTLVRRQQYDDAEKFGKDLLKMKVSDLLSKHGDLVSTDEYKRAQKDAEQLQEKINKASNDTGFFNFPRKMKLAMLKMRLKNNPDQWASSDFMNEIRDDLSEITGEDAYADEDKPNDYIVKKGEKLVGDIKETSKKFSWLGSPIIKTKLASLKSEVESDITNWDEGTLTEWRERLQEIAGADAVNSGKEGALVEKAVAEENKDIKKGNTEHVDSVNVEGNPFTEGVKSVGRFVADTGKQLWANTKHLGGKIVDGAKVVGRGIGSAIAVQGDAFRNGMTASTYGAVPSIQTPQNDPVQPINTGATKVGKPQIKTYELNGVSYDKSPDQFLSEFCGKIQSLDDYEKLCKKYNVAFNGNWSNFEFVCEEAAKDYLRGVGDYDSDDIETFCDVVGMKASAYRKKFESAGKPAPVAQTSGKPAPVAQTSGTPNPFLNKLDPSEFKEFEDKFASGGFGNFMKNAFSSDGMETDRAVVDAVVDHVKTIGLDKYAECGSDIRHFLTKYPMKESQIPAGSDGTLNGDTIEAIHMRLSDKKFGFVDRMLDRYSIESITADSPDEYASGGFATSTTPSIDADGNPILYGEAGTEAIMPIRSRPGNLLSRVGSKVGDILSGKSVGPMSDGADSASVHAGTDESEPMENMMANELAKTVKRHYSSGGFALFEEGGFVDNIKERAIAFGEEAALAALAPIASTVLGAAIASIVPILVVLLGPALMTFIGLISTAMMVEYYEKGEYGKMAGALLAGGIAAPLIIAVFALLGIGGAALGGVIAAGGAVASAEALLRGINKALLPKSCQEVVNDAIGFIGKVYTDVTTAALGTAATAVTAPMTLGKAAITGDFNRSEYIREGESALGTVLNAPHRALDNAAGWAGVGINKVVTGIGGLFGIGGDNVEAEAKRQMKNGGFARFANGGFLGSSSHPELLSGGSPNKPLVDLTPPKPQPAGDGLLSALTSTVTGGTNPAEALQKLFSGGSANNGKELADQLAALAKSNQQIYELLESALNGAGVKIQGMDALTEVCAQPSVAPQAAPKEMVQPQASDPHAGLDLRKIQA